MPDVAPVIAAGESPTQRRFSLSDYLPLKETLYTQEFRLLKIEDSHTFEISCTIHRFKIHHAPPYRALSYTWRNPFAHNDEDEEREYILVGGEKVYVGKNLANALRALRDWHNEDDYTFVWADAICIDQYDPYERAYQVAIMGEIFGKAQNVFIWLGEEAEDSDRAIHFLKLLAKLYRERDANQVLRMAEDQRYRQQWKALENLLNRRWWARAWVLQEVVLAREGSFACGRATLPSTGVFEAATIIQDVYDELHRLLLDNFQITLRMPTFHALDGMKKIIKARLEGILFPMVLCHFRTMSPRCTNPRDHIFAKIGMAADGYIVEPSYTDSVEKVYAAFVLKQIQETASLDIIHVDGRARSFPDLPSWVPDWSAEYAASPVNPDHAGDPRIQFPYTKASLGEKAQITPAGNDDDEHKVLTCRGYIFDTIDGVAHYEENSWAGKEEPRPVHQPKGQQSAYKDDDATFEALWRSLFTNQENNMAVHPAKGTLLARSFHAACSGLPGDQKIASTRFGTYCRLLRDFQISGKTVLERMERASEDGTATAFPQSAKWNETEESMAHYYLFRRLFTTDRGYVGVAPPEAESGDVVAILLGSSVPVVLHRLENGDYKTVGAAYVHGIMYGEGLQSLRDAGKQAVDFRLV